MSARTSPPSLALTDRDYELLLSLYAYRYLSTPQIQRLHFPSAQTATRRLRLLAAAGYVSTFRSPALPDRLATLAKGGAEVVAARLSLSLEDLGWNERRDKPKDYLFLKHFLDIADFRITLTHACATHPDINLLGFLPEYLVERSPAGATQKYIRDVVAGIAHPGEKIIHTPDAVFALEHNGSAALFFLEVDRGSETIANPERGLLKTARFYLIYLTGSGYQRYRDDFHVSQPFSAFRVLFVTSTQRRLENIRQLAGGVPFDPPSAKRFLWLADSQALTDPGLLGRPWASLDPSDSGKHTIAPTGQVG